MTLTPAQLKMVRELSVGNVRKYFVGGDEDPLHGEKAVYVEWRGQHNGKGPVNWCVKDSWGWCLAKTGAWEWEPQPSSRTTAFVRRTRWPSFEQAYQAALAAIASDPELLSALEGKEGG